MSRIKSAGKISFPIDQIIKILKREVQKWNDTAVGQISRQKRSPFQILIATMLSLRTKDEVTGQAARRLLHRADSPEKMLRLSASQIARLIYPVGFYQTKARNIRAVCHELVRLYGGRVPDTMKELLRLKGVGRKTANLVIIKGFRKLGICVDTHVHRICNRWGYVNTKAPDETELALRHMLPKKYWMIINDLLVVYGQNICLPVSPLCSKCKLVAFCKRQGVKRSR